MSSNVVMCHGVDFQMITIPL